MGSYTFLIIPGIVLVSLFLFAYGIGFTSIGTDEVGIVEKWWSFRWFSAFRWTYST